MIDDDDEEDEMPAEVVVGLEDQLDLHVFAPRDVRSVTEAYLEQAAAAGLRSVRLIHGRGIGVQRKIVRSVLARHPAVVSYADAPDLRSGRGATIVELRAPDGFDARTTLGENGPDGRKH